jgi:alcohol dehydrogenase class IV
MDSVKAVKTMQAFGVRDVVEIMRGTAGMHTGLKTHPIHFPHIAIPTTAGTGAESSPVAVVLIEQSDLKGSIMHPDLPANVAVLDPTVTYSLPPRLTAETGCDALSHCMEAYFCMNSNSISDGLALHAAKLIKKYLPIAIEDGRNVAARTQMLIASNMAMQAYSMAATSAPIHNCSHAIGAKLHISHGLANGVLMSTVMKVLAPYYAMRIHDFAQAFGVKTDGQPPDEITAAMVTALEDFKKQCGIPAFFPQKLTAEDVADLRLRIKADIAGFTFPLPMEAIDAIMYLSFAQ